jgi:ABC-type uncharacterized transport system involved in gliding motility auxiliary subunit
MNPAGQAEKTTRGGVSRSFRAFAALGVLGAALLAVNLNVLVARWYKRWDLTADRLYTLSPATLNTLHALDRPLTVTVFLSRADPLSVSVRQMLVQYWAYSRGTPKTAEWSLTPVWW